MAEELLKSVYDSLLLINSDKTISAVNECLDNNIEASTVMKTLADAMIEVGERFNQRKFFLPQVILAAGIMEKSNKILIDALDVSETKCAGKVVIGTIEGDIHDLGKNIVATMLKTAGMGVIDLGKDVPVKKFLEAAKDNSADIVACSSLMSTTMPYLKDVVELRSSMGCEEEFKIMVGGAPVSQGYADQIGADAYAKDAMDAVRVAQKLIAKA